MKNIFFNQCLKLTRLCGKKNSQICDLKERINRLEKSLLDVTEKATNRIKELEAEVKEWKDKAGLWCKTANLKDHNIMINKELEKENAELKERNRGLDAMLTGESLISNELEEQLTKAKEIIKNLLSAYTSYADSFDDRDNEIVSEAEQFLNSEVVK